MMGYRSLLEQKKKQMEITIQDYTFNYYNDLSISVYDGTTFYSLEEASNKNLLTSQELKEIYDIHQEEYISLLINNNTIYYLSCLLNSIHIIAHNSDFKL